MSVPQLLSDARLALMRAASRWMVGDPLVAADLLRTAITRLQEAQRKMLRAARERTC